MIMSNLKGRLRLKNPLLKGEALGENIRGLLASIRGIRYYQLNTRSGSLLIVYDPATLSLESLLKKLKGLLPSIERDRPKSIGRPKYLNIAMLFSLVLSMVGALMGAESFHQLWGMLFIAALGLHLYQYRKILLWR